MTHTLKSVVAVLIMAQCAWAHDATSPPAPIEPSSTEPSSTEPTSPPPADLANAAEDPWTISLSAYYYIVPDESNYIQPTLSIDYDWLHLEARHNYEDLDTASAWIGCNFSFGEDLTLDFTPMFGALAGDTDGIAPGYELTLGWRNFELYSEGEYVIDLNDSSDNYFYTWTELTYAPADWLRAGVVIQRTRAYDSDLDIQRGVLVGLTFDTIDFTATVMNPDDSDPIVTLGVSVEF
jgi:hypothetical protein